jgi:hypothetical protein
MPSTIVKLCSSDARAWAHNQPVWIEENGEVARPVTRAEQHAISRALERSARVSQSFREQLPLLPPGRSSLPRNLTAKEKAQVPKLDCAFQVQQVGKKRVVTVFTGTLRYVTGRELLAARLLADHGESILHGRNGKQIAVLRDPFINEREPREPGPRVQFSRDPHASEAPKTIAKTPPPRNVQHGAQARSPAQCPNDCRGKRGGNEWSLSKDAIPPSENEHHPMCNFAPAWARTLTPHETGWVIYDFERAEIAREASAAEVAEANKRLNELGVAQVTISERVFGVLTQAEAEQAMREARGEDDDYGTAIADAYAGEETRLSGPDDGDEEPELEEAPDPMDGLDAEAAAIGEGALGEVAEEVALQPEMPRLNPRAVALAQNAQRMRPASRATIHHANTAEKAQNPRVRLPPSQPTRNSVARGESSMRQRDTWPEAGEVTHKREKEKARLTVQTYLTRHDPSEGMGA